MTPYEVLLVRFPFSDIKVGKVRPALLLRSIEVPQLSTFYLVAMMTSNVSGLPFPDDIILTDWKDSGLPKPSLVRLAKLVTIDATLVKKSFGVLSAKDSKKIKKTLDNFF